MRAPAKLRCPSGLAALRRDHLLAQMMTKAIPLPPLKELEQLLDYDPETGVFRWKISKGSVSAGSRTGIKKAHRYAMIRINGRNFLAHRIAWYLLYKEDPKDLSIDHVNGNRYDNRACNLRLATHSQNLCNRKAQVNNSSGYKGVVFHKASRKWAAYIGINRKLHYLGIFSTPELAHMAYCKAAAELHGNFARAA